MFDLGHQLSWGGVKRQPQAASTQELLAGQTETLGEGKDQ